TVTENMILGSEPSKARIFVDMKTAEKNTRDIIEKYNFNIDPKARIRDLSVGMKQQVEILKALYRDAKILILDEPTAVLAPQETTVLFEQLRTLKDKGYTIIFISHKINEVIDLCDRLTVMRLGKTVGTYDVHGNEELGTKDITVDEISRLMVGRDAVLEVNKEPSEPTDTVLYVDNVTKLDNEYKVVVDQVSFAVRKGEILAIGGIEGNGQRELVDMITGTSPIDIGDIRINRESIKGKTLKQLHEKIMAYIPQDRMVLGVAAGSTIEDNVVPYLIEKAEYQKCNILNKRKLKNVAESVVKEFDVRCKDSSQPVGMLSGGNIQKVVVARELSSSCKDAVPLVVADQPSRGIDIGATKFIHRKLIAMRDEGYAILLISADLNEVFEVADSAIILYEGKINAYFPDMKKVSEYELGQYMLGLKAQTPEEIAEVKYNEA
ncbi:MAG: ATP-binding cassette domain-containing protein, partial [Erysipelotrichaceae bacterium]|nr:ATP-binding cassette domain-containing protein [Erysipelotrichaceae bacterium]